MSAVEKEADLLTLQVAGRAALPVRAIPFLTGWAIPPDELASQLARLHGPPFDRLRNTAAYHLVAGKPVQIKAGEWRQVVADLEALEAQIRDSNPKERPGNDPVGYSTWCRQAVSHLPAGVFIHRDQFERDFADDWHRVLRDRKEFFDDALSYAPMALRDREALVFEGFADPSVTRIDGTPLEINATPYVAAGRKMVSIITSSQAGHSGFGNMSAEAYQAEQEAKRVRQSRGYFTLCEAAQLLADEHDFDAADFVRDRMLPAVAVGALHAFDPKDWGPLRGRQCRDFHDCVTPESVNRWLRAEHFPFRWPGVEAVKDLAGAADDDLPGVIRYGDLPDWLATLQRTGDSMEDHIYRAMLAENWKQDLRRAVHRGELRARTPATRELVGTPYDDAIVLTAELRPFLEGRGLAHLLQAAKRAEVGDAAETPDAQAGVDASEAESPEARRARLRARFDEVRATGVRDYAKRVADEEGITPARLRQILNSKPQPQPASPFDLWRKR